MNVAEYTDDQLAQIAGVKLLGASDYSDNDLADIAGVKLSETPEQLHRRKAYRPSALTQAMLFTPGDKGAAVIAGLDYLGRTIGDYFGGRAEDSRSVAESYLATDIRRPVNRLSQVLESTAQLGSSMLSLPEQAMASLSPESETGVNEFARGLDPRANIAAYPSVLSQLIKEGVSGTTGRDVTQETDPMVRPLTNILSTIMYGNANPYAPSADESIATGEAQYHEAPGNLIMTPLLAEGAVKMIPRSMRTGAVSPLRAALGEDLSGPSMLEDVAGERPTPLDSRVRGNDMVGREAVTPRNDVQAPVSEAPKGPVLDLADGVEPQVAEIASRALVRDPKLYDELLQLGHDPVTISKMTPEEVAYYVSGGRIDYRKQGFVPQEAAKGAEGESAVGDGRGGENALADNARVATNDGTGTDVAVAKTSKEMAAAVAERIERGKTQSTESGVPADLVEKSAAADPVAQAEVRSAAINPREAKVQADKAARDAEAWAYLHPDYTPEPPAVGEIAKDVRPTPLDSRLRGNDKVGRGTKKVKEIAPAKAGEVGVYPGPAKGHVFRLTEQNRPIIEALSETAGRSTGTGKSGAARLAQNAPWWNDKGYNMSALRVAFGKAEKGEAMSAPMKAMLESSIKDYLKWRKKNLDALKEGPPAGFGKELAGAQKAAIAAGMSSPVVVAAVLQSMPGEDDQAKAVSLIKAGGEGLLSAALVGMAFRNFTEGGGGGKKGRAGEPLETRVAKQEFLVERAMRKRRLERQAKLSAAKAQPQVVPAGYIIESGPDQIATNTHDMAMGGVIDHELRAEVPRFPELMRKAAFGDVKDMGNRFVNPGHFFTDIYRNGQRVFGAAWEKVMRPFDEAKGRFAQSLMDDLGALDREVVKKYGITKGSRMSQAVQLYGEKIKDETWLVKQFGIERSEKIKAAERWFRQKYEEKFAQVNMALQEIYPTTFNEVGHHLEHRADYFHHFREMSGDIQGIINALKTNVSIDPQLAALSEFTSPKSTWWGAMQRRFGVASDIDAVGGYLNYLPSANYKIHIDPQLSVFNQLIRDLSVTTGSGYELVEQSSRKVIGKFATKEAARKVAAERLEFTPIGETKGGLEIRASHGSRSVNNFITYLTDWTQGLANKSNFIDRPMQKGLSRGSLRVLKTLNARIQRNAILMNASSSIVQVANLPIAMGELGVHAMHGMRRTYDQLVGDGDVRGVQRRSNFLRERYGISKAFRSFDASIVEQPGKVAAWVMGVGDETATRFIWNGFYEKALRTAERDPVRYADIWTRKMVAGRGVGEVPLAHQSTMGHLFMPFQIEVGNQWLAMKEMNRGQGWRGLYDRKLYGRLMTAMVASYAMNEIFQKTIGRRVLFDPIEATMDMWKIGRVRNMGVATKLTKMAGRGAGEVLSNLPLGQTIAAAAVDHNTATQIFGTQNPTRFGTSASPLFSTVVSAVRGGLHGAQMLAGKRRARNFNDYIPDVAYQLIPPYGGAQIKRSVEGIAAVSAGRSRTAGGEYQFSIHNDPVNLFRAALFGKYATPEGRRYIEMRNQKIRESGK